MSAKPIDYQEICREVCQIARRAGAFIAEQRLTFSSEKVLLKGRHNLVSYVDKEAEKMIIAEVRSLLPDAHIIGEEGGVRSNTQGKCHTEAEIADHTQGKCHTEAEIADHTQGECHTEAEIIDHTQGEFHTEAEIVDHTQGECHTEAEITDHTQGEGATNFEDHSNDHSSVPTCQYNNSYPMAPPSASEYCWVIDPLDGTTNFVHGMPPYCVSIALMLGDEVVVGVIYEITANECFYAWQGSNAYLNDSIIVVSTERQVENSLVITGMAYQTDFDREELNRHFDYFNVNSHGARRTGSAAANLAYIAAGRAECFFQRGLAPWDVAAGVLIVERAKGLVSDYSSGDGYVFGQQIVASNGVMHQQFIDLVR